MNNANIVAYIQGEKATVEVVDAGYTSVSLVYGGGTAGTSETVAMAHADGKWRAEVPTDKLCGVYKYAVFADGVVVESGEFSVRALVSQFRRVVAAIDEAMRKAGTTGVASVSFGEINLTNKNFAELREARDYYAALAAAEEAGESAASAGCPVRISGGFA